MTCSKCGKDIPEDSIFCPNCGILMQNSNNTYEHKKTFNLSFKGILIVIAVGIWMLVLQNFVFFTTVRDVKVKNTVDVSGAVDVGNSVDVNLQYINGRSDVFFNNPRRGEEEKYYRIPVTVE